MPITKKQFDLGIDDEAEAMMRKVELFLREHRDQAYSLGELWERQFGESIPKAYRANDLPLDRQRFVRAIDVLCEHGVLEARRGPGGMNFYTAGKTRVDQLLGG